MKTVNLKMKTTYILAGIIACIFSINVLQAQERNQANNPMRKLQLAQFAIANL